MPFRASSGGKLVHDAGLLHLGRSAVARVPDTRRLHPWHLGFQSTSVVVHVPRSRMSELSSEWHVHPDVPDLSLSGWHSLRVYLVQL